MKKILGIVLAFFLFLVADYNIKLRDSDWEQKIDRLTRELVNSQTLIADLSIRLKEAESRIKKWTAVASWYGPGFHGRTAADGSIYDQNAYTVAHKSLPFGTVLVLEANGNRIPAVVTDRGPYIKGRDLDLSYAVAQFLGIVKDGVVPIKVYQVSF